MGKNQGIVEEIEKLLPEASFSALEFVFYYLLADIRRHSHEKD